MAVTRAALQGVVFYEGSPAGSCVLQEQPCRGLCFARAALQGVVLEEGVSMVYSNYCLAQISAYSASWNSMGQRSQGMYICVPGPLIPSQVT